MKRLLQLQFLKSLSFATPIEEWPICHICIIQDMKNYQKNNNSESALSPLVQISSCVAVYRLCDRKVSHSRRCQGLVWGHKGNMGSLRHVEVTDDTSSFFWTFCLSIHTLVLTSSTSDVLSRVSKSNHGWDDLIVSDSV